MSQQGFYIPHNKQAPSYNFPFGNQISQQNFTPILTSGPYASFDNVKSEHKNQLFYNNNISEKKYSRHQEDQSPEFNDLFEIQKKRKKQKYKRSTNNSHKKFISALRRLFYAVISTNEKDLFEAQYSKYRSCRTFFFIILAYMKHRFSQKLLNSVRVNFINEMRLKITEYQEEVNRTKNVNLKNFREEEIIDIRYSIKSCNEYLNGNTRQAIQCMYKKDKSTVIKRQHYEQALKSVHKIEKELSQNPKSPLQSPYIEDYSNSSDRQKIERKVIKRQIRFGQMSKIQQGKQQFMDFGFDFNPLDDRLEKKGREMRPTNVTQNAESDDEDQSEKFDREAHKAEILYPPLLEAIPFMNYDPFLPPFRYKRETRFRVDVRQDFFGAFNYGFPKFYQRPHELMKPNPQFAFSQEFPPRF